MWGTAFNSTNTDMSTFPRRSLFSTNLRTNIACIFHLPLEIQLNKLFMYVKLGVLKYQFSVSESLKNRITMLRVIWQCASSCEDGLCLGKQWCYLWIYTLNNHPDTRESSLAERQLKEKLMWASPPLWGPDIHLWDWLKWCSFSGERYCR